MMNPALTEDQRARLQLAHSWIKKGDENSLGYLKSFLEDGGDANACLGAAVSNFSLESTKILLEYGANPNFVARYGSPALHILAKHAGHMELFLLLLDSGADINVKFVDGNTPLLHAVKNNDRYKVEVLIKRGCDVMAKNNGGDTALHLAAINGFTTIISMLLKAGIPVDIIKHEGPHYVSDTGMQALHFTAYGPYGGHHLAAEVLIKAGANPDAVMSNGRTTLHLAAMRNSYKVAEVLIRHGCNINAISSENNEHKTPLMHAIDRNHIVMVRLLISAGADLSIGDQWGCSPLSVAIFNQKMEMCLLLIQAGAAVNQMSNNGKTPFDFSVRNKITAEILVLAGCEIPHDLRLRCMQDGDPLYQHLQKDPDFLEKLIAFAETPRPLTLLCRSAILNELGFTPSKKIDRLPIADSVKNFLQFCDIEIIMTK